MTEEQPSEVRDRQEEKRIAAIPTVFNHRTRRLTERESRTRDRATQWLITAVVGGVGGALLVGVGVFNDRWLLAAFGGCLVYVAALTYYLAPENSVSESVTEQLYRAYRGQHDSTVDSDASTYVPDPSGDGRSTIWLVNDGSRALSPSEATGDSKDGRRQPVGAGLFEVFVAMLDEQLARETETLADQTAAGLVDGFGLVDSVEILRRTDDQVRFRFEGCALGPPTQFDHPAVSFVGATFAAGLGRPVRLEVARTDGGDYLVDCIATEETAQQRISSLG